MRERKAFIEGSIDSVDAIFSAKYHRLMTRYERYITRSVMLQYGVFSVRAAMTFCTEFFTLAEDAMFNLRLVCKIRPE